jgi:hypothetical protein
MIEETVSELRAVKAPGRILGAAAYHLAGVRARQLRADEALDLLEEGLSMREDLRAGVAGDEDFASLRGEPRFRALRATS